MPRTPAEPAREPSLIEWGWLVVGPISPEEGRALDQARELVRKTLEGHFPGFVWQISLRLRTLLPQSGADEPVERLQEGAQEREAHAWDFALVLTPRDLRTYYQSFGLAVPSRALAVALVSLARISPFRGTQPEDDVLARRIAALALHLFGDLNGLWHRDERDAVMHPPQAVEELDERRRFAPDELEQLRSALEDVADLRLEEAGATGWAPAFYLRASWTQLREIASAVVQAHPWEFPLRLGRLTAAALSALFLLLVTAEVWDLAMSQSAALVVSISLVALGVTTSFIISRQKLILRRTRRGLSERVVVANVSAALVVLIGMLTTYALLFVLTLAAGSTLYDPELVTRWAPSVGAVVESRQLLALAGFVASLGLAIGSLGASFEGNQYFRHVIYADEET